MAEVREDLYARIDRLSRIGRAFQESVVLLTAVELELFTLLDRRGPLRAEAVARELGLDCRAAGIFLYALAGMGLLEVREDAFANSPLSDELLVAGRPAFQGDILRHNQNLIGRWMQLPQVLRSGEPAAGGPTALGDREQRRNFILGMSNIAGQMAGRVGEALELSGVSRVLDLGGGPATYAIEFCRMNPRLRATVFDLPPVIDEVTAELVREAGLSDRIDFIRGDYLQDELGSGYDLVLISNIIHSLDPEQIGLILRKSLAALRPGGRVAVKDFLLDEDRVNPPFSSMFSINMLVGTHRGRDYTAGEVRELLKDAGFGAFSFHDLTPQSRIMVGVRP